LRILIAEDDAVSRKILQRALEQLGHQCICARDGHEAWEIYKRSPSPEVVMSGWEMPGIDGVELCERIRRRARGQDVYPFFVFWTARTGADDVLTAARAGADHYLAKPLDRRRLQACMIAAERITSWHRRLARRVLEEPNSEPAG